MRYCVIFAMGFALAACFKNPATDKTPVEPSTASTQSSGSNQVSATEVKTMSPQAVREGYIRNATLAQLYRWYQIYENDAVPMDNSLDILSSDISVKSGLGQAKGHISYAERVEGLPKEWENAHKVKSTDIEIGDDGTISMTVDIIYENKGLLPNAQVRTAELTYLTRLAQTESLLPKFDSIEIKQNTDGTADDFTPLYAENRIKSLLHYWFAIIEDPRRDAAPAREIFADDFVLNFSSGAITDFAGFEAWLAGPASAIDASTHTITAFDYQIINENEYAMQADFEWQGIQANGTELVAKTRHKWIITDDPMNRFSKIKQVDVELIVPFQPKPN